MDIFGTISVEGLEFRAVHQTGLAGGHDVAIMLGDEVIASASISKISRSRSLKIKPGAAAAKTIPMADAVAETPVAEESAAPVAEAAPVAKEKIKLTEPEAKAAEPETKEAEELAIDEDDLI